MRVLKFVNIRCVAGLLCVLMIIASDAMAPAALAQPDDARLAAHVKALREQGRDPIAFVNAALDAHDLVIFDDGLHTAVEPFRFYAQLVRDPEFQRRVKFIFFELIPVNKQRFIDAYLVAKEDDPSLLYPAFQGREGFPLNSYFDLLATIREVNLGLPETERFRAIAVSTPSYWAEIETREDWLNSIERAVLGRDYDMYALILADLQNFESGEKGVFLTNTRHAYKGLRDRDGRLMWNAGTFFHQWHEGKTTAIRFNAPYLNVARVRDEAERGSATGQGLERIDFSWARAAHGLWDEAFREYGEAPVAISLADTPFGEAPYLGNRTHVAAPGQTMFDVYDAVIFLAPFERQMQTATVDALYTPQFKHELERRLRLMRTEDEITAMLEEAGVTTLAEYIDAEYVRRPETPMGPAQAAGPMDAWRGE